MTSYFFQTQQMTVGYDGKPLIHDISIGIQKGEIVTLIGPNGSGKSTILKSITRQLKLLAGTVYIDRENMQDLTHHDIATRMAVVLTQRVKPEWMTCWDVAASGRYPYTGRLGVLSEEDRRKVKEALQSVHALDIAHRDFNAVSDGQRQHVLLARALCQEPEIIVLDEPTSFLDVRHKLELLSLLSAMARKKGITVILSLHEIDLAQKISDKILCVKGDTIRHFGTPDEIFRNEEIRSLYDIEAGFFDPLFGNLEMPRIEGEPEAMVLSAGGTGIPVYRRLQKEHIPFSAGILYTNDADYQLARLLAVEVIGERPFHPIGDAALEQALRRLRSVPRVMDAGVALGPCNEGMKQLIAEAKRLGKWERA